MSKVIDGAEIRDGVELYDWEDYSTSRKLIFDDVLKQMEKHFKDKSYNGVKLSITNIGYADPDNYSIEELKQSLHNDGFLSRRLRGTATLTDETTGEVLDKKDITLMKVPYLTNRGTFIREGNEWGTINQIRLLPGAYSRYLNNGVLETQFNVRPGTGGAFKVSFDPESAIYKLKTQGLEFHLYSLLSNLGVSDEQMKKSWGEEIFEKNKEGYDPRTLDKAYNKLVPAWDRKAHPDRSEENKIQLIKDALQRSQMSKQVAKLTLPNLFDRTYASRWSKAAGAFEKLSSMSSSDLKDVATYINESSDKNINTEDSKDNLVESIKSVIRTGLTPLEKSYLGEVDAKDRAAAIVRQMQQHRLMGSVIKKIENKSTYGNQVYGTGIGIK